MGSGKPDFEVALCRIAVGPRKVKIAGMAVGTSLLADILGGYWLYFNSDTDAIVISIGNHAVRGFRVSCGL